jgi:hypothetical protein
MMEADIQRLEAKLDKLTDAVMRLVVLEERQTHTTEALHQLKISQTAIDVNLRKLERNHEKWVNRCIGAWGLACVIYAVVELVIKRM